MVFDGYRVCLRPLVPGVDASDVTQAFISYIDVGRSKFVRRRDLKVRWYFHCECTRCSDKEDDYLTAIKCSNSTCDEPLVSFIMIRRFRNFNSDLKKPDIRTLSLKILF